MKKSILMLINGFGIERKDSVEIYSNSIMPNLDNLTTSSLFGSLSALVGDYNNAYRLFSISQENEKKDDKIDEMIFDRSLYANEGLLEISSKLDDMNTLHIYYTLTSGQKSNQLREIIKAINPNKNKHIYIHLILMSTDVQDYTNLSKVISKLSFEMGEYCKLGFIVGKNKIQNSDFLRTVLKEFGEHWNEVNKKLDILKKEIVVPEEIPIFHVNKGFALKENDIVLFLNYNNFDLGKSMETFISMKIQLYSLYEFNEGITNIFVREKNSSSSFSTLLENRGIKILILTENERINDINFYLNGMEKKTSNNITFAIYNSNIFVNKESIVNLLNQYDGIIIDYHIGLLNKVSDIKNALTSIDKDIKPISEAVKENDYTLMISSLYGMHAQVMDGVLSKVVNFSQKVPCIFENNSYPKGEYSINQGNTYDLALTFLTTIDEGLNANRLIHKRTKLEKLLSKK